jgi:hypothetical protein
VDAGVVGRRAAVSVSGPKSFDDLVVVPQADVVGACEER